MSYKNPLYGRRTAQIKLSRIPFLSLKEAFPGYSWQDLVKVYGCIGGIPAYFQYFNPAHSVEENIEHNFYRKVSILYEDAERLLKDELREPIAYLNILRAINDGKTKMAEIANEAGGSITNMPKYLKTLETLDLIYKEYPVVGERKARRGIYRIKDMYYRFWLKFVYPYRDDIEIGIMRFSTLSEDYNKYLGSVFEDISKEFLIKANEWGILPFKFTHLGRWWDRENEIDIVAMTKGGQCMFFEVKWSDLSFSSARRVLHNLETKAESVHIKRDREYFGIISRKISGKKRLRDMGYLAFDLTDFDTTQHGQMD